MKLASFQTCQIKFWGGFKRFPSATKGLSCLLLKTVFSTESDIDYPTFPKSRHPISRFISEIVKFFQIFIIFHTILGFFVAFVRSHFSCRVECLNYSCWILVEFSFWRFIQMYKIINQRLSINWRGERLFTTWMMEGQKRNSCSHLMEVIK